MVGLACFLGSIRAMTRRWGREEMGKKAVVRTSVTHWRAQPFSRLWWKWRLRPKNLATSSKVTGGGIAHVVKRTAKL